MSKYLEKLKHFRNVYKHNGGLIGCYLTLYRTEELKWGNLVGTDKFGNKYFENQLYFMGRSRWINYSDRYGMDYDGSQVPAEWHRWLCYIGDEPPTEKPPIQRKWIDEHSQNFTGTGNQYVPYSTTTPKIEAWKPPKSL